MTWPDYAILAIIALSSLVGVLRGFIKEVFSLAVWAAAFLVAWHFSGDVAEWMSDAVTLPSARLAMGFAGLFVAVLLVGGLANYLLGKLVASTGLSGTDRLLGGSGNDMLYGHGLPGGVFFLLQAAPPTTAFQMVVACPPQ
mgnify:CR=1 FL=1